MLFMRTRIRNPRFPLVWLIASKCLFDAGHTGKAVVAGSVLQLASYLRGGRASISGSSHHSNRFRLVSSQWELWKTFLLHVRS